MRDVLRSIVLRFISFFVVATVFLGIISLPFKSGDLTYSDAIMFILTAGAIVGVAGALGSVLLSKRNGDGK